MEVKEVIKENDTELKTRRGRPQGLFCILLWMAAWGINIKSAFTDFAYDTAYSLAMSYRHVVLHDRMFGQMWEPHQTSIFLSDLMLRIYRIFVPDLTGAALFLQIGGILLFFMVAVMLTKILSQCKWDLSAHLAGLTFFVVRAKQSVFPEYSNGLILFSVLALLSLYRYETRMRRRYVAAAGITTCLFILSYPSALICLWLPAALFILAAWLKGILSRRTHPKEIAVHPWAFLSYLILCGCIGLIYGLHFIAGAGGPVLFLGIVKDMLSLDQGHMNGLAVISGVAKKDLVGIGYLVLYLLAFVLIRIRRDKIPGRDRQLFYAGGFVSAGIFLSVCAFTNLSIYTVFFYLVPALVLAVWIIAKYGSRYAAAAVFVLICSYRLFFVVGFMDSAHLTDIRSQAFARSGMEAGLIVSKDMSYEIAHVKQDFESAVAEDDRLFVSTPWIYDPCCYTYAGQIAAPSLINTPTYSERIENYWEQNPDKRPTVIAVSGYRGADDWNKSEWLRDYMEREGFVRWQEGEYFTFYRKPAGKS